MNQDREKFIDPVCHMLVSPETAIGIAHIDGKRYYFCSSHCLEKFQNSPHSYTSEEPEAPTCPHCHPPPQSKGGTKGHTDSTYTCPMHPEVVQDKPGSCPICGMDLEIKYTGKSKESSLNHEYKSLKERFIISLILLTPLLVFSLFKMLSGVPLFPGRIQPLVEMLLATPIVLYGGSIFFKRGYESLLNKTPNMFTLISIGTGTAFLYSVIAALLPTIFPENMRLADGTVPIYFESAASIITLILLGQMIESRARNRTNTAIKELMELYPRKAKVIREGKEIEVDISKVKKGDVIKVYPGERIPVDGSIIRGECSVDESMITGESIPAYRTTGDMVIGGTINLDGNILIKAESVGEATLLSRIIELVSNAQRSKPPIQKLVDRISYYFVPIILLTSGITFVIWLVFGPEPSLAYAVINSVSVLIIACPCALGLATPMSITVSMGKGAKSGILIKNAEVIEKMNKIDTLILDKTGTLTEGNFEIKEVKVLDRLSRKELLEIAASVEQYSEHPIARTITEYAAEHNLQLKDVENFRVIPGIGAKGYIDKKEILIGNAKILEEISTIPETAGTTVYVKIDGKLAGYITISDRVKSESAESINNIKKHGIETVLLTGDKKDIAEHIASELGIKQVFAEVLPDEKLNVVKSFQKRGKTVAMAGDGINDAPALAQADIGIGMGTGTDIAIESADVVLIRGDLRGIDRAITLADATFTNIKQNLFWAFFYNTIGIPVAAGVLYPFLGILLSPVIAAVAMSFSSISVVLNSLRLNRVKLQ